MQLGNRRIGTAYPPLVIAEIGINHEGCVNRAHQMIEDAANAGCECVKFQCHVVDDEYVPAAASVIPGNAQESILDIMRRCALTEQQDIELKKHAESLGLLYLSTPFSRAAAARLQRLGVAAFKIGSGECNNTPLLEHIARLGKPVLLSTGMNGMESIARSVRILEQQRVPLAILHCTSMYPTPYSKVRLGALAQLRGHFPRAVLGLSDHSLGIHTCLGAVALGASVLEKHFTSDTTWPGPDIPISITPSELRSLCEGSRAIFEALGGQKEVLAEEQPTIDFAYASVVTTRPIARGETLTRENLWVKRPGTGDFPASSYDELLGSIAQRDLSANALLRLVDVQR